jgi:glycine/D-amino acid oxidase-like deaminating enzyme
MPENNSGRSDEDHELGNAFVRRNLQAETLSMSFSNLTSHWGQPPWEIDFTPAVNAIPEETDFAVIGGGFTGQAAAAWLRLLAPEKSVAVFEAARIGSGASGRTGGIALAETAAGDLPGLGDVLGGFEKILQKLDVDCNLSLPGAWEIGRAGGLPQSPIEWTDSGTLRVVKEVPGGTLDPGKLVSGLARAAEMRGAKIFENAPVMRIRWSPSPRIELEGNGANTGVIAAEKILLATNALSLGLTGLNEGAHPRLTLAALTTPLTEQALQSAGLGERKPFYTADLPYLWGRVCRDNSVIWGAGLVSAPDEKNVVEADISSAEAAQMFESLEKRVRGLHPAFRSVTFTHRWGGPILFRDDWQPVFDFHPACKDAIVLGAYAGHGVALSSYLAAWAAEVLLGKRALPAWGRLARQGRAGV